MATIYGTYSCGHEGQVYFPGSRKAVEWRAEREFERVCPECQAIENEKEVSALREKYGAADADLPMLKGTDKQILWAEKIRNKFREEVRSFTSKKSYSDDEMIIRIAIDQILEIASAKWWIENKDAATRMIKKYASANIDEIKAELARDPSMIPQTAEASPARLSTPTVAEVIFTDNDVKLKSDKDSVIREVARKYHMNWSGTAWVFEISSISGSPRDRAVELGNLLLCAGSVSGWPPCGQKRGRGCGGGAPGAMATHENGRHQYRERATRKGESSRFFDNAVILLLELSAFASWVESESVYPIPPYLKSFVRGIFTPEGSLALWSACSNYLGVGTPSYYSLLLILTDKYINCKGTPETPYIVAFGSITELSEITV